MSDILEIDKKLLREIQEQLISNPELQVTEHWLLTNGDVEIFLRVIPKVLDLQYQHSVFAVVSVLQKEITLRIFSYDTTLLHTLKKNEAKTNSPIESLITDVQKRLLTENSPLCPGYKEVKAFDKILIQQSQDSIIYRSRECTRLTSKPDELCEHCTSQLTLAVPILKEEIVDSDEGDNHDSFLFNDDSEMVGESDLNEAKVRKRSYKKKSPKKEVTVKTERDINTLQRRSTPKAEPPTSESEVDDSDMDQNFEPKSNEVKEYLEETGNYTGAKFESLTRKATKRKKSKLMSLDECGVKLKKPKKEKLPKKERDTTNWACCPVDNCTMKFKACLGGLMIKHMLKKHGIDGKNPPEEYKKNLEEQAQKFKQLKHEKYVCKFPDCGYVATGKDPLERHTSKHSDDRKYCCDECGKSFKYLRGLYRCTKKHQGVRKYSCPHCEKKFIEKNDLDQHIIVHTDEKPFQCPCCDFRCNKKNNLNLHSQNIHDMSLREAEEMAKQALLNKIPENYNSGSITWENVCGACGKSFFHKNDLIRHEKSHNVVKPFPCSLCEKSFSRKDKLKDHQSVHTGEKPFSCNICNKTFTKKYHMRRHLNNVHGLANESLSIKSPLEDVKPVLPAEINQEAFVQNTQASNYASNSMHVPMTSQQNQAQLIQQASVSNAPSNNTTQSSIASIYSQQTLSDIAKKTLAYVNVPGSNIVFAGSPNVSGAANTKGESQVTINVPGYNVAPGNGIVMPASSQPNY